MDKKQVPGKKTKKVLIFCSVILSFIGFSALIILLARTGVIAIALAVLLLVALVGIYCGFGILIGAHLVVRKLE